MVAASMIPASPRRQAIHQRAKSTDSDYGRISVAFLDKHNSNTEANRTLKSTTTPPQTSIVAIPRRFPSPGLTRGSNSQDVSKRATSAERRRPGTSPFRASHSSIEATLVAKRLWPSSQSMSSSMQSDSSTLSSGSLGSVRLGVKEKSEYDASRDHSLKPAANGIRRSTERSPICKPTPERKVTTERKGTPERKSTPQRKDPQERKATPERKAIPERKATLEAKRETPERKRTPLRRQITDQAENARPLENNRHRPDVHRWPGTSSVKASGTALASRSESVLETQKSSMEATSFPVEGRFLKTVPRTVELAPFVRSVQKQCNEGLPQPPLQIVTRKLVLQSRGKEKSDSEDERNSDIDNETSQKGRYSNSNFELTEQIIRTRLLTEGAESARPDSLPAQLDNLSDSDSVSSGSSGALVTSGLASGTISGITVPARFPQELGSRIRHLTEGDKLKSSISELDFSPAAAGKEWRRTRVKSLGQLPSLNTMLNGSRSPFTPSRSFSPRRPVPSSVSNSQTPHTGLVTPSPTRPIQPYSPSRRMPSPTRPRGADVQSPPNGSSNVCAVSQLSFRSESFKGKQTLGQCEESLLLRIFHNRWLQWHFVNALGEASMNAQSVAAERLLYNSWMQIAELQTSVSMKRIQLQKARQEAKLNSILSSHGEHLQECETLEQEHSAALIGAREALSSTVLRVPLTGGARADLQAIRETVSFSLDVLKALDSSVRRLNSKSGQIDALTHQLTETALREISLLHECSSLLGRLAGLEIEERSLKNHCLQLGLQKVCS